MEVPEIFTFGSIYGWKSPYFRKSTQISWLGNICELFMSNVHAKLGGAMCYLPVCTSVYWQSIYIKMDIGLLSAVATALPWLFKQYCSKCFTFEGSFIWIYQKHMPEVMCIWRTRVGQGTHTSGTVSGYQGISIQGSSGSSKFCLFLWRDIFERGKILDWLNMPQQ